MDPPGQPPNMDPSIPPEHEEQQVSYQNMDQSISYSNMNGQFDQQILASAPVENPTAYALSGHWLGATYPANGTAVIPNPPIVAQPTIHSVPSNSSSSQKPPSSSVVTTWHGFVDDALDACILFQLASDGVLPLCERRPHDIEKSGIIQNGSVIIYEEESSGIKRWTDGLSWSPSRVFGKFLIYREVNKADSAARKQTPRRDTGPQWQQVPAQTYPNHPHAHHLQHNHHHQHHPTAHPGYQEPMKFEEEPEIDPEKQRRLVGSLIGTYDFKRGGYVKRTASCIVREKKYHLVAYFTLKGHENLQRPVDVHPICTVVPRQDVLDGLNEAGVGKSNSLG